MHLDDAQVAALVDGELGAGAGAARAHLAECAECRALVEAAGREVDWLDGRLQTLDHDPPAVTAAVLARRAAAPRAGWRWRWAAGVALAVGFAGVAWAAPGSPLPGLVRRLTEWASGGSPVAPAPTATPDPDRRGDDAGISVRPGAELVIEFGSTPAGGTIDVELTAEAEVVVRGPAGAATFTSEEERLVVQRSGSPAAFEVQVPHDAPRVEIRAGATRLFLKAGERITAPVLQVDGRYSLSLP